MDRLERLFRRKSIIHMSVEVETPTLKPKQVPQTSSSIEDIKLKFQVQVICNHFLVQENGDTLLVRQHATKKDPFATHQLPVKFFHHSNGALQPFLSLKFKTYGNRVFNLKTIADEIIKKWTRIKEAANSNTVGKVFSIIVTIKLWKVVIRRETVSEDGMVPTSNNAIEMLTRVKTEEVECGQVCVICLEDIKREEESAIILQIPCLHVFHEECIKRWLKNSHYCPTCRFDMPID